ncbi:MAG: cation diffusion facilitator family transporter [Hydrogenophaga sp.]|jgi:cation diffusion facilitator family transporter|uniref:cation diffusion facilitator family transporter n=1 Tax=Hydrogenophaga sp. TaxID=1904254 RepID=UPI000EBE9FDA|nr:cation diffusion facilitator family transporter [Hydrogenophaga sp.]MDD3786926.1 cation diffusion facilitator family transporter [Hydrogenophaga sp.]MDX9969915.1 cation diffusion facilitator family transporter [Hydrogenophaga sp.]HAJ12576.1 cation diffusion facilitator family transporter [Comamonadaceae bacterium]
MNRTLAWLTPRRLLVGSVLAALATIGLKTLAWYVTGSVGLLSDALESLVNLASAVFALAMVTIAQRPADDDHPYGHTKAEYFSSGFEGVLILGAALAIGWAALERLFAPQPLDAPGLGLSLSVLSALLNGGLAQVMHWASRHHRERGVAGSEAVEADARHLMTDVYTTAGVLVGVGLVYLTGWLWLDPLVALLVAANIVREGVHLMKRASDGLMDHALDPELQQRIDEVLARFVDPQRPDLLRFDHLITRRAGQRRFVDLHMHLPASWSLGRAALLRADVEQALMSEVPGLRATIQLLPDGVEVQFHEEAPRS